MRLAHAATMITFALVLSAVTVAHAAPGDYQIVVGTLVWPDVLMDQRLAVVDGDNGFRYFAELASPEGLPRVKAGDRVAIVGRQGAEVGQITLATVSLVSATLGAPPPPAGTKEPSASPSMTTATPPPPSPATAPPLEGSAQAIVGTVDAMSGAMLTVDARDGRKVTVDMARIDTGLLASLTRGQEIRVLAAPAEGRLVAEGVIVEHTIPAAPAGR